MTTGFTPALIREVFRAHRDVWLAMRSRDLTDWEYLRDFSRKLFWIARMCGERGLLAEADEALAIADAMVATRHAPLEIRAFRAATRVFGWPRTVRMSEAIRRRLLRGRESRAHG
jgi:hypothetical protein